MTKEISRAEQAKQEQLPQKPKAKDQPKEEKSKFDQVLERSQTTQKNPIMQQNTGRNTLTEQAVKEGGKHDERKQDDQKRDSKDKDQRGQKDAEGKETSSGLLDQRVMGKGKSKQGQSSGQGQTGYGFSQSRRGAKLTKQKGTSTFTASVLQGKFAQKLKSQIASLTGHPQFTQSVLNQMVAQVRISLTAEEKEIELKLKEKFFKGLKFKVTSKNGRVTVEFITADAKDRATFENNSAEIRAALEKRGIVVEDIRIT
ncbi:MAG: hypothetical protein ABH859_02915 [Pseudomonadota bacterium]